MYSTDEQLLALAESEGFRAALLPTAEVPIDAKFRKFCEENLCGNYGANYACPPDCGTVEQLRAQLLQQDTALVISTVWDVAGFDDKRAVQHAKATHNAAVLRLTQRMQALGYVGFCTGYNGCPLCSPCRCAQAQPCPFPQKRISCMSAYCIDVAKLAARCGLEFGWIPGKLFLFGMIAFHREDIT